MATDRPLITPHRSTSPPCNFHSSSAAAFDNRFRDVLALFSIARRGREIHRVWKNRHEEISQVFATCEKTEWNQLMEEYIGNGLHTRGLKGSAFEAPRIWLQLRHTSPTIFLPSLPPSYSPTSQFTFTINLQIVPIYPPPWKWKHHAWEYIEIPCITAIRGLPRGALTSSRLFPPFPIKTLDGRKISRNRVSQREGMWQENR